MGGGKSNKQTIGYWYDTDVLATFCYAVDEVVEIQFGERVGWAGSMTESGTVSIYKDELFGGEKREGGVYGQVDFMFGEYNLPVNEFLGTSMRLSNIQGPVPAYRGTFNLFFRGVTTVDPEFTPSGVFEREASPAPASTIPSFTLKSKAAPRAFRWSALNPYFKPFKAKVRRYTKDWNPDIAKIITEGNFEYYTLDTIDQDAYSSYSLLTPDLFIGTTFNTGAKKVRITYNPDGVYEAWSPWDTDVGYPEPYWNKLTVIVDGGAYQHFWPTMYPTMAGAATYASNNPITFNVNESFQVGLLDSPFDDNRGGISLKIEVADFFVDMNPAHIIRECLINSEWGMGYPTADIDDARFTDVAQVLYDEGFGISLKWTQKSSIEDFILLILRHINGVVTQDRSTGKFFIKLIRDDYVTGSLQVFDESNCALISYGRAVVGEIVNEVVVKYTTGTGGTDSISVQDLASIADQGQVISQEIDLPGLRSLDLVARVAQRELESRVKPIAKLTITTNRTAFDLYEGDVFKFSWSNLGISNMVCRVLSIDLGDLSDNAITIEAIQDVFGLPSTSFAKPSYTEWTDSTSEPVASPYRYITETPYYDIARSISTADLDYLEATDCYIDVFAQEPTRDALGYNLWTAAGTADLVLRNTSPHAGITTLTADVIREEVSVLEVANADLIAYLIESENACVIVNGEYMHITDYDTTANTITVNRGVLDTVPAEHVIGDKVILSDSSAGQDEISYIPTEVVHVKAQTHTSKGDLAIGSTPEDTYTILQRQARPYPPGQVRVNTVAYPPTISLLSGLSLTWAHRNRLTQTASIIDQATGSINPETNTVYNLRIYGDTDTLIRTESGLTGTSFDYTTTLEIADGGGVVPDPNAVVEPWWDKTKLLLHFNGANASTTFVDSSPNFVTAVGNAQISTAQSKFGGSSGYFDGTGDYLSIDNAAMGTADFTVEGWIRATTPASAFVLFDSRTADADTLGFIFFLRSTLKLTFGTGSPFVATEGTTSLSANTWYHIALVKTGGNVKGYLNGVLEFTVANSSNFTNTLAKIGHQWSVAGTLSAGYIDDMRITKGVARYTSGFTPPTGELGKFVKGANFSDNKLMLTFDGVNGATTTTDLSDLALAVTLSAAAQISTTQSKFGGSSLYLDGTAGTYAQVPFHISQAGSGVNLTVECHIYATNTTLGGTIASRETNTVPQEGWLLGISNTNRLFAQGWDNFGAMAFNIYPATVLSLNTWYHVALVRNGTTWTLYLDGTSIGTATESAVLAIGGQDLFIGKSPYTSILWNGYIDEFRLRDLAAYTSNFTAPTVSNCYLDSNWSSTTTVLNFNGNTGCAEIENVAELTKTLTAVGNAQISTAQSKFGGSSGYFDGTGDYLTYPNNSNFSAASGDFTVEAWIRPATVSSICVIVSKRPAGGATATEWEFFVNASGQIAMVAWNSGGSAIANVVGTTVMTVNTWYHVAMCRSGTTWRVFVNGVLDGSGTQSGTVGSNSALLYIGYDASTAGSGRDWNGYIDDLRITRGARYLATFTPPASEFAKLTTGIDPQWDNVSVLLNCNGTNGSTTFSDSSSNNLTVTATVNAQLSTARFRFGTASALFDGTGDFLSIAYNNLFNFGLGDFTVESWVYIAANSTPDALSRRYASLFTIDDSPGGANDLFSLLILGDSTTTGTGLSAYAGGVGAVSATVSISQNAWHHIACSRKDGVFYLFLDGVLVGTPSALTVNINTATYTVKIGGRTRTNYNYCLNGNIDDFRVTKGFARYTATFVPPVVELSMNTYSSAGLNSRLRFELESERDGLVSWTMHDHEVTRV